MDIKKIPYGLTDYERITKENYYYVDKTHFIPVIEQAAPFFFLIRPRRFGKSLLLNVLTWYYDMNRKDRFNDVFEQRYIAQHPTPEQGRYMILSFNFSAINPDPEQVQASFHSHCTIRFIAFAQSYGHLFNPGFAEQLEQQPTADAKLSYLTTQAALLNLPIYLIIDEYDNFCNTMLARQGTSHYQTLTHSDGFFRFFFNKIKEAATGDGPVKRMFITGVSPVTMDDVTSGFNIGSNQSADSRFNAIVGFTETEVRQMLAYYKEAGLIPDEIEKVLAHMKPWYNNYCFSEDSIGQSMYNSDMVLYYLNYYLPHGKSPAEMVDNNVRTDYNKLRHLIRLDKKLGLNFSVIQEIIEQGQTTGTIKTAFPAEALTELNSFKSLLFYFGMLSIEQIYRGKTVLSVPNLTVREQLYSYIVEAYQQAGLFRINFDKLGDLAINMAYEGEWRAVFEYMAAELQNQSAIREFIEGEAHVKGFLLAYLGMTTPFIIWPEYEAAKGYADFYFQPDLMRRPDIEYSYIAEIKYLKHTASQNEVEAVRKEASSQLQRYASDPKVTSTTGNTKLRLITIVFRAWELAGMWEEVKI